MKCPKCGAEIKAPWEPSWIDEYSDFLSRQMRGYSHIKGTGEHQREVKP